MKKVLKLLVSFGTLLLLVLPSLSVFAIDFDTEKTYESVFIIYSGNAQGSGFAIGNDAIISNYHVINDESKIYVQNYSGNKAAAKIIAKDEQKDLVLLGVENASYTPIKSKYLKDINVGDEVYALGAPEGMDFTLTKGILSVKQRDIDGEKLIQFDAAINEGNSGGPLLSGDGAVIGVNTLKLNNSEGISFAIPMDIVAEFLKNNNISIDDNAVITASVFGDKESSTTEAEENTGETNNEQTTRPEEKNEKHEKSIDKKALLILLSISGFLNVVLFFAVVSLVIKNNRDIKPLLTDKDRTDFDIEILE